jgi:hypothetical protein
MLPAREFGPGIAAEIRSTVVGDDTAPSPFSIACIASNVSRARHARSSVDSDAEWRPTTCPSASEMRLCAVVASTRTAPFGMAAKLTRSAGESAERNCPTAARTGRSMPGVIDSSSNQMITSRPAGAAEGSAAAFVANGGGTVPGGADAAGAAAPAAGGCTNFSRADRPILAVDLDRDLCGREVRHGLAIRSDGQKVYGERVGCLGLHAGSGVSDAGCDRGAGARRDETPEECGGAHARKHNTRCLN